MRYIINSLINNRWNTLVRLLSIGLGMSMGIFLLIKVAKDTSYDSCFRDTDHLMQVWFVSTMPNGESYTADMGWGMLAGALEEDLGEYIESATKTAERPNLVRDDGMEFNVEGVCSDASFFKTMGVEVISGNPETDLALPHTVYLSDKIATEMFGSPEEAVGKMVRASHHDNMKVAGIFKDYGDETTLKAQFVFGQPTYDVDWGEENGMSWHGATWWNTYARLRPGVKLEDLNKRINDLVKKNVPDNDYGSQTAIAKPIRDTYRNIPTVKRMNRVLGWLGVLILVVTVLNYVLLSISAIHRRSKAIGVFKCLGSGKRKIFTMILCETALIVGGGLLITALCWWLTKQLSADTIYASITSAVSMSRMWVGVAVAVAVFALSGIVPAIIYSRISPSHLFQKRLGGNGLWKRGLLLAESCGAGLACCLLMLVVSQYHALTNADLGYDTERLVMITGHDVAQREAYMKVYESLPYVETVTASGGFPGWGYNGVRAEGKHGQEDAFLAKSDNWSKGYADMMGIKILYGRQPEIRGEVAVNRTFTTHFTNNPEDMIGEQIVGGWYSEPQTVVGVIDDYRFQNFFQDIMPLEIYALTDDAWRSTITLRLSAPFEANLDRLANEIAERFQGKKITVRNMHQEIRNSYKDVSLFAILTGVASVIIVFITLAGLIGYVTDEMERRRKEIAVRRINGATAADIIAMFAGKITAVCAAGVACGGVLAWIFSREWLEQFKLTVENPILIIGVTGLVVVAIIYGVAVMIARRIAIANPSQSLRSE